MIIYMYKIGNEVKKLFILIMGGEMVEKNSGYKLFIVIALLVATIGLAVGFAAFTGALSISGAKAGVKANDTFSQNLKFKSSSLNCDNKSTGAVVINTGVLSDTSLSNIEVQLSNPGDYVECSSIIENASDFIGYLNNINSSGTLQCSSTSANAQGVSEACNGMKVSVTVGSDTASITSTTQANLNVDNNTIDAKGATPGEKTVKIKIEYLSGSSTADSDFDVSIPQINLIYDTEEK